MASKDHICNQSERILTNELNQQQMAKDLVEIKNMLKIIDEKQDLYKKELEEKLNNDYSKKWVEKVVIFIGSVAGTVIIGAFMYLIINKG